MRIQSKLQFILNNIIEACDKYDWECFYFLSVVLVCILIFLRQLFKATFSLFYRLYKALDLLRDDPEFCTRLLIKDTGLNIIKMFLTSWVYEFPNCTLENP